jgi:hypothetical protein
MHQPSSCFRENARQELSDNSAENSEKTSAELREAQSSRFRYGADNVRKLVVYTSGRIDHDAVNARAIEERDYRGNPSMTAIDIVSSPLSEADHRAQLCRAVIASTVGTTIEWYDFSSTAK